MERHIGNVKMQSTQLPQVTEFKYLGGTLQSDEDMHTEVNKSVDDATGGRWPLVTVPAFMIRLQRMV